MSKSNRGKTLKRVALKTGKSYRGTCPLCGRTGVKLLYPLRTVTNELLQVCKHCRGK